MAFLRFPVFLEDLFKEDWESQEGHPLKNVVTGDCWDDKRQELIEKNVLSEQRSSVANEEKKQLLALTHTNSLRIINTLAYFKKNPEKLRNPSDQVFFQQLVFQAWQLPTDEKLPQKTYS